MPYNCDIVDQHIADQIVETRQCPGVTDDPVTGDKLTDPMVFLCGEGTSREYIKCYNKSTIANMYKQRHTVDFVEPSWRGRFTNSAMAEIRRQIGADITPERRPLHVMSTGFRPGIGDFFNAVIAGVQNNVKRYLDSGGYVDSTDNRGNTALMKAAFNGDTQMVMMLAMHGADINARNEIGMTPLMAAAASGRYNVVDFLLRSGANPRLSTYDGRTARDFASTPRIRQLFSGPLNTRVGMNVRSHNVRSHNVRSHNVRSRPQEHHVYVTRRKPQRRKRSPSPKRKSPRKKRKSSSSKSRKSSKKRSSKSKKRKGSKRRSKSRKRR